MKLAGQAIRISTLLLTLPLAVQAEDFPVKASANLALTSNYVWRGFTQTNEDPAIQGGFGFNHESGASLSVWGSNVKFLEDETVSPEDRADLEFDVSLGYEKQLPTGTSYKAGYTYYSYPGAGSDLNYNFSELTLGLGYTTQGIGTSLSYSYAPDFFGGVGKAHHYDLTINYTYPNKGVGLEGQIGQQTFKDNEKAGDDYLHYSLSVFYLYSDVKVSLSYSNTDLDKVEAAKDQVFFTLSKSF